MAGGCSTAWIESLLPKYARRNPARQMLASPRLSAVTLLDLDSNRIGWSGLSEVASALRRGGAKSLRRLFVDKPKHPELAGVCCKRRIELSKW